MEGHHLLQLWKERPHRMLLQLYSTEPPMDQHRLRSQQLSSHLLRFHTTTNTNWKTGDLLCDGPITGGCYM